MRKLKPLLLAIAFVLFVGLGLSTITKTQNKLKLKDVQLKSTTSDLIQLQLKYDLLNRNLKKELDSGSQNQQKIQDLEKQKQDLEQQRDSLQKDLQAKAKSKADAANRVAQAASIGGSGVVYAAANCGSDPNMAFIYQHESGCRTDAVNSIGCRGIAQACPGTKLPCGADFACQDAYFKSYAIQRYGSTLAARIFWEANSWW